MQQDTRIHPLILRDIHLFTFSHSQNFNHTQQIVVLGRKECETQSYSFTLILLVVVINTSASTKGYVASDTSDSDEHEWFHYMLEWIFLSFHLFISKQKCCRLTRTLMLTVMLLHHNTDNIECCILQQSLNWMIFVSDFI